MLGSSKKRRAFSVKNMQAIKLKTKSGIVPFKSNDVLRNEKLIVQAILESFKDNDPDAVIEILDAHLRTVNKSDFAEKTGISRSTLYDMLHGKKNPTLRVFIQCIHEIISRNQ
jgi:DNA-binding phage protein